MCAGVCRIVWNYLTLLKPLYINLLRVKSVRWQWKHIHSFTRGLLKSEHTCLFLERSWRIWQLELYLALCRLVDDRSQVAPKALCAFLHIRQEGQVISNYLILNTCSGDRCFYTNVRALKRVRSICLSMCNAVCDGLWGELYCSDCLHVLLTILVSKMCFISFVISNKIRNFANPIGKL